MTGFGQAEGTVGTSRVLVEVRTVNHRFFSPSIKLPGAYGRWETEVREAMRLKVSRGHVTLTARSERLATQAIAIDDERFAAVVAQLLAPGANMVTGQTLAVDGGMLIAGFQTASLHASAQ